MLPLLPLLLPSFLVKPTASNRASIHIQKELSEPFNYFAHPTDQLGFPECPLAAIVTYDGAFLTPYGQLSFYVGRRQHLKSVNKRVKTFLGNDIPIINFAQTSVGLDYSFQAFCAPINLKPQNEDVLFVQCTVSNPTKIAIKGALAAHFGSITSTVNQDPANKSFLSQRKNLYNVLGTQRDNNWYTSPILGSSPFSTSSFNSISKGKLIKSQNHVVLNFLRPQNFNSFTQAGSRVASGPEYDFTIPPHSKEVFRFLCPMVPIPTNNIQLTKQFLHLSYLSYRSDVIHYWKHWYALANHFDVSDPKVMATLDSSLAYDLMAEELNSNGFVYQRVNKLQYNYMWIRDSSFFVRAYDDLGLFDVAHTILKDFLVWKDNKPTEFFQPGAPQPNNARLSVQDDYWGQVLWAFGSHIRMSGDQKLLNLVYPILKGHIALFVSKIKSDPRGLWPVAGPYDNEAINGHYTGHSLWAILGLKNAIWMAKVEKDTQNADKWQKILQSYKTNFLAQLRKRRF